MISTRERRPLRPNGGVLSLTETNVLGADARGDNTSLTLRGVGPGNTRVLVNGRRLAPHPISQAEGGVPSLTCSEHQPASHRRDQTGGDSA